MRTRDSQVKKRNELKEYLQGKYSPDLAEKIVKYVYDSNGLNRKCDTEYETLMNKYNYKAIVKRTIKSKTRPEKELYRKLRERYPNVQDFRTLGYFWILAKEQYKLQTFFRAYLRGFPAIAIRKTLKKTTKIADIHPFADRMTLLI